MALVRTQPLSKRFGRTEVARWREEGVSSSRDRLEREEYALLVSAMQRVLKEFATTGQSETAQFLTQVVPTEEGEVRLLVAEGRKGDEAHRI